MAFIRPNIQQPKPEVITVTTQTVDGEKSFRALESVLW
jgi:hypothetical protein